MRSDRNGFKEKYVKDTDFSLILNSIFMYLKMVYNKCITYKFILEVTATMREAKRSDDDTYLLKIQMF